MISMKSQCSLVRMSAGFLSIMEKVALVSGFKAELCLLPLWLDVECWDLAFFGCVYRATEPPHKPQPVAGASGTLVAQVGYKSQTSSEARVPSENKGGPVQHAPPSFLFAGSGLRVEDIDIDCMCAGAGSDLLKCSCLCGASSAVSI